MSKLYFTAFHNLSAKKNLQKLESSVCFILTFLMRIKPALGEVPFGSGTVLWEQYPELAGVRFVWR